MSQALVWAIVGVALVIAELMSMSFVLVFFGVGALLTALLVALKILSGFYAPIVVFSVASLALMALMRSFVKRRFSGHKDMMPDYLGQVLLVVKDIPAGGEGTVSWRGSEWLAFADETTGIAAGDRARVIGRDGIRLMVERVEKDIEGEV
ncbi:MAG TPA: NfeD family protein [Rectinemataceae bacterium]|nr:NfeD family protein [Rectinemataceae bacterium]